MIISPFNPLFFSVRKSAGIPSPFVQFFSTTDTIVLEVIRASTETAPVVKLHSPSGDTTLTPTSAQVGTSYVDYYSFTVTETGEHYVSIGDEESETFCVTSDTSVLADSVLIEYSPLDNRTRRDVAPIVGESRIWFAVRMPGGFKDSGHDFSVDSEQFTTQEGDIVQLYAHETVQETLTVGTSEGVPIWFGQLLNRLLTCAYVYIDKRRYARYESSVPEKNQPIENINSFILTQKLQRINYIEPSKQ